VAEIIKESTPLLYSSIGGRVLPLKEGKEEEKNTSCAVKVNGFVTILQVICSCR
jgi:hypothetical protein